MRRKYLLGAICLAALVATGLAWTLAHSSADQGVPSVQTKGEGEGKPAMPLPIAQVVLFNSGVGYVQREGDVTGDTRVELTFPTSDINDLLKSLVLQDTAGGHVDAISYDSQDPVEKILRSFALDLNGNPSYGQILNQARGEKIEVQHQEKPGANPQKIAGTIIGMESHKQTDKDSTTDVEQLNLLTADGMLSIPLPQVLSVRFQNKTLESEFRRALQVLAGSHDVQKKSVALMFSGNGKRAVKVGYVLERPIWKTTYRLVLEAGNKLFMQGWAIVENTSDDDWNNIRMVLVSGKPISFRMDLYEPLYIPRPLVEPELFASLRPPVYGGSFGVDAAGNLQLQGLAEFPRRPVMGGGMGGMGGFPAAPAYGGYPGTIPPGSQVTGKGVIGGNAPGAASNTTIQSLTSGVFQPSGALNNATPPGNNYQNNSNGLQQNFDQNNRLAYDEMMRRKDLQRRLAGDAKVAGQSIAGLNFKEGIQSIASSEEIGDYFQYVIDQKISLARQKSAMLPIINQSIAGSKVSIFNESVHAKFPLLGIRLKNTSGKPLTQGPITVYEDGSYAGDTRTLDLQPNEERLLSYALDQGTEAKTAVKTHPAPAMTFNIGGNNLTAVYTMLQTKTYTFKNRSIHPRTVLIEHPIRGDWKLVDPAKPSDRSRDVYRFQIEVNAGEAVKQDVVEEQSRTDPVALQGGKDIPPHYAIFTGIEIKPEVKSTIPKLQALVIRKGVLEATYSVKESKTYFIQNQSERDHVFTIDHVIRKEWKRLAEGADGKAQPGPDVFTFKIEVKSKKTAQKEVAEEHVYEQSMSVAKIDDEFLRKLVAEQAPAGNVKQALQQVLDQRSNLRTLAQKLSDAKSDLKILAEDQARVRENLKIIPQTSEHYKDFLKKFVAQEAQIDDAQKQIRTQDLAVQMMQKDYETFVNALTVQ